MALSQTVVRVEVTVAEGGQTQQYYRWVTKVQRFNTVSRQEKWSEEYRRLIFIGQSPFLFGLPQRLDRANPETPGKSTSKDQ